MRPGRKKLHSRAAHACCKRKRKYKGLEFAKYHALRLLTDHPELGRVRVYICGVCGHYHVAAHGLFDDGSWYWEAAIA